MAGIPVVGPALGIAAASAAVAAGLSNVARIRSSEPSGYATGGLITGGEQVIKVNEQGTESVVSNPALTAAADAINDPNFWNGDHARINHEDYTPPQVNIVNNAPGIVFKQRGDILTTEMTDDLARLIDTMLAKGVADGKSEIGNAISTKFGVQGRSTR
jgi:hypothetical protein